MPLKSNREGRKQSGKEELEAASPVTTLNNRQRKRAHIKPAPAPTLLAYAMEKGRGRLEKRVGCMSEKVPASTSHCSSNSKTNPMTASCPVLPRCSGSHTGLLEQEPTWSWLTTDVPLLLSKQLGAAAFFPRAIVITKICWAPGSAGFWSKRKAQLLEHGFERQ